MSVNVKSAVNKVIAQGEDFPIFFRLYPYMSTNRLDSVWFETDEGITTETLFEPPYGETCQLIYYSAVTKEFSTGEHHVRLWGSLDGMAYVLTELIIAVNPAFPFTSNSTDIDYTYQSSVSNTTFTSENAASIMVSTYTGRLAGPAQWAHNHYVVEHEDDLPVNEDVQIGDTAKVTEGEIPYMICVDTNPVTWKALAINDPESYILNGDEVYINCQPFEITE